MIITIAGYGFVGQAHEAVLKDKFTVNIHDPHKGYNNFGNSNGVIICVSTPPNQDSACDASNVIDVLNLVDSAVPVLIKSTISLEAWQFIKEKFPNHSIAFSPEFLRSTSAVEDFKNNRHILIGGGDVGFWHAVFRVAFDDPTFTSSVALPEELILAKYFRNSFLATKVAFFNQVYDLCTATGIDYNIVSHMIAADTRIGVSHTTITPERGFGGHCFPKDTAAIVHTGKLVDVNLTLIEESIKYNKSVRKSS